MLIYRQDARSARPVRMFFVQSFAILALLVATAGVASAAAPPSFEMVVRSLTEYFKSLPDYQRGDLMSQQQVSAALAAVAKVGWEVPDAEKITELALPDNSFLVGELATPDGKRFMRKISRNPGTYSRLDRLSRLSQGQQVVSQMVGDVGGDVFITYLATTNSGHNLGQMMAGTPKGTDLNLPTGRIYTADDLLGVLKKAYVKEFGKR
jgi:hypothetical protein